MSVQKTIVTAVLLTVLSSFSAGFQEPAVETVTAEVFRVVGNSVIIKNEDGELKMYHRIPDGVRLFVDGEPAELGDLREGMTLRAIRFENTPEPISVSMADAEGIASEEDAERVATASGAAGAAAADAASAGAAGESPSEAASTPGTATPADAGGGTPMSLAIVAVLAIIGLIAFIVFVVRRGN